MWIMLRVKLPTGVSPPKLGIFWSVPWKNAEYIRSQKIREYGVKVRRGIDDNIVDEALAKYPDIPNAEIFITIEPIMDFNVDVLSNWIIEAQPSFVNIGADSKGTGLIEPSADKVRQLINLLSGRNITIKKKTNLQRLLG